MRVLFLHQNFPGQFGHVAKSLAARPGTEVLALADAANPRPIVVPTLRYTFDAGKLPQVPAVARTLLANTARGEVVARALKQIAGKGFTPDIVVGHPGWGETYFVRDVFPNARLIVHAEFFYSRKGADVGFDPEFAKAEAAGNPLVPTARNAGLLLAMNEADLGVVPTAWQARQFPSYLQPKLRVQHEGIDTGIAAPSSAATFAVPGTSLVLKAGDEVVTFVNRNLEPYRGYHVFLRALPEILRARPNAHVVLVGGDGVSYGASAPAGSTWKQIVLDEVKDRLPLERVHFAGKVPYPHFIALMQLSAAHVYLTYPFVLSWSMLEAMSCGALVIGSATPPVTEVIRDGDNGLLFDFFDTKALAGRVIDALANPGRYTEIRSRARATIVERYDLAEKCLPGWLKIIEETAALAPPA